jgi:hypothetical protein
LAETTIAPLVHSLEELVAGAGNLTCSFKQANHTFDYFLSKRGSKTLLVFLPSAQRKENRIVPVFHRWTWSRHFSDCDVLSVSDPILYVDARILGGWLLGDRQTWLLEDVLKHVAYLQSKLGYENVVFCGSSLGGFCAIQAGGMAAANGVEVGAGGVYAENPQINLMTYSVASAIDLLARTSFGVASRTEIAEEFQVRLNVVKTLEAYSSVPRGLVVIKESDKHHFEDQLPQLEDYLELKKDTRIKIEVIPAEEDPTGHSPLTLEQMKQRVYAILAG